MRKPIIILIAIIIVSAVAVVFITPIGLIGPMGSISHTLPWRLGLDLIGGAHLIYEVDMSKVSSGERNSAVAGLRDVIEKRVNLFGVSEPLINSAKEGDSYRLIVELAGIKDVSEAVKEIGSTPLLDFREILEINSSSGEEQQVFMPTNLTGRYIKSASVASDNITNQPSISVEFNDEGAKIFEELTERNVGKPLGIFLDNNEISAPVVREKISGGKAQISGQFTKNEAIQLVSRFNAGALPAPINLESQQLIGASLGSESLQKAIYAGIIGTIIVMIFMIIYYRFFGFFAAIALLLYTILTLSFFKASSMTITLSGIAGFILSIGMAVDANILIFERVKEEIKNGASKLVAIEEGFKRAWPSIRDSNISTIITAFILYYFTSSFVKGFALTLGIGVVISMFSAIITTRTLLRIFVRK
ncbi:MAG: protein translocase subunit SecD [Patescibacteria group bacterium]